MYHCICHLSELLVIINDCQILHYSEEEGMSHGQDRLTDRIRPQLLQGLIIPVDRRPNAHTQKTLQ